MKKFFTALIIIAALSVALCSCSSSDDASKVVSTTLDAIKASDSATASKYIDYNSVLSAANICEGPDDATKYNVAKTIYKTLSYKIVSASSSLNSATVKVQITNIDMSPILKEYVTKSFASMQNGVTSSTSATVPYGIMTDLLSKTNGKTVTNTVTIKLEKKNDSWYITLDQDLVNALDGGATNFINNVTKAMQSAATK